MTPELWVAVVVALFSGGGIAALWKMRGESAKIVVDAAQGAVVVQSSVIDDLQEQVADLRERMTGVETRARAAEERALAAEKRAREAEGERDRLLRANTDLRERVAALETEVIRLGGDPDRLHHSGK